MIAATAFTAAATSSLGLSMNRHGRPTHRHFCWAIAGAGAGGRASAPGGRVALRPKWRPPAEVASTHAVLLTKINPTEAKRLIREHCAVRGIACD
jgi:hypothetical protein